MKPDVAKLRQTILQLAVEGKLVQQDSSDEPAAALLKQIEAEKQRLISEGAVRKNQLLPTISDGEKPFEIPESWMWVRLGNVTNYATLKKVEPKDIVENTWVLEMEDVEAQTSVLLNKVYTQERPPKSTKNIFEPGDIIYGKLRPYLNKVIIADEPGICTTEMIPIRAYTFLPKYLFYYLKSPTFIYRVNELTKGINLPRLTTTDAVMQALPLPPMNEQKRIVARVDELMALCDELEGKSDNFLETLGKLRQNILQLAVEGKLVSQDPSDEPAHKLLLNYVAKPQDVDGYFDIPNSWVWATSEDVSLYIQRGKSPKYVEQSSVPVISQKCVQWSGLDLSVMKFIDEKTLSSYGQERFIENDDLLINSTGTGTIGRIAICLDKGGYPRIVADSHVTVVRTKVVLPKYYYYWWSSSHIYPNIENNASGSTNQIELNLSRVKATPLPLPPLLEQERIVAKVDELMSLCDELESKLTYPKV